MCLANGTLIQTETSEVPVEHLRVGDVLKTKRGHGQIRWIGRSLLRAQLLATLPNLRPIMIRANALGQGFPRKDLKISRQHRIMFSSKVVLRMFDVDSVLVPANKLVELSDIDVDNRRQSIMYHHILLADHEVIFANGVPTESFYTGPGALHAVGPRTREKLVKLFPALGAEDYEPVPALRLLSGKQQKQLVERHRKNKKRPLELYEQMVSGF